jgi:hypothetical protein
MRDQKRENRHWWRQPALVVADDAGHEPSGARREVGVGRSGVWIERMSRQASGVRIF